MNKKIKEPDSVIVEYKGNTARMSFDDFIELTAKKLNQGKKWNTN